MKFIILAVALLMSGCETARLWSENSGDEYIEVVPRLPGEDVEDTLKESGRKYYCQELYASTYPTNKVCYAQMTSEDRAKNIEIRLRKTPEALAIDAGHTIQVIGSVALNVLVSSNFHRG